MADQQVRIVLEQPGDEQTDQLSLRADHFHVDLGASLQLLVQIERHNALARPGDQTEMIVVLRPALVVVLANVVLAIDQTGQGDDLVLLLLRIHVGLQ